ncbi:MAG TPA: DUF2271 domain-containing protein [Agitococcus sp.]|nr:DUF2271 domain-containing protein [Agitococcus sp.]HNB19147.1 DUF2271 domain-containing protein [Agitococcus sp.]HNC01822.1 DUF2271 domain-containing protein [Agitococcus sp.]HNJ86983.1 DUF2271 domain-containing protein [Agitococcus sp.]HNL79791.1 DUF2271 domain-containing protein [Agitococcus sp.]
MKKMIYGSALAMSLLSTAQAAELAVNVQIPSLNVAEYHRPYVAIWIEDDSQKFMANLAVWYDLKKRDNGGTKWLKDLRQWWRKSGRELTMPVDGVSGATRNVGEHQLSFSDKNTPLDKLAAGRYQLVVEAAREGGGREVLKVPFEWLSKKAHQNSAQGQEELGKVTVAVKP